MAHHPSLTVLLYGCAVVLLVAVNANPGQAPFLVRDIELAEREGWSSPEGFVRLGDRAYFAAWDSRHGNELWTTDGTAEGTWMVKDINPGRSGSSTNVGFISMVAGEHVLWMIRDDGVHGNELWWSDGSTAGTHLVKDINPGPFGVTPAIFVPWGDRVFLGFSSQLWISDGSLEGTTVLDGLEPPYEMAALGNQVVIRANSAAGDGLWLSDGTSQGTTLLFACSSCSRLSSNGEQVFFSYQDHLWSTDGSVAGTTVVGDLSGSATSAGDTFSTTRDAQGRIVLWYSSGSGESPIQLTVLREGQLFNPYTGFHHCGPYVLFSIYEGAATPMELWRTDRTSEGTEVVLEGVAAIEKISPEITGKVVFSCETEDTGREPWVSDGTAAGTHLLLDIYPGEQGSYPASTSLHRAIFALDDTRVLFNARDDKGFELWTSDGTSPGTQMVTNIFGSVASSDPAGLTALGDAVLFTAASNGTRQLWVSDGSNAGTLPLTTELPVSSDTLVAGSSKVFFSCIHPSSDGQPCISDGTPEGTGVLVDLGPVASSYEFATAGDWTYFVGYWANQQRLWRSDGTAAGTELVTDFNPSWICNGGWFLCTSYPRSLTPVGASLYLVARSEQLLWQLWRTDGNEDSTVLIAEGDQNTPPSELVAVGAELYYVTAPGNSAQQWALWRCSADATEATLLWNSSEVQALELTAMGERLLLILRSDSGDQLWQVRENQLTLVADLGDGGLPGYASQLTVAGGRLFFSLTTALAGPELWVSSGVPGLDGTGPVKEIVAGAAGSYPAGLVAYRDRLLFTADDGVAGRELWVSDGTADGTFRVADVEPGPAASSPAEMTPSGGLVLFAADAGSAGRELWAIPATELFTPMPVRSGGRRVRSE